MIVPILALAVSAQQWPAKATFACTGIPSFTSNQGAIEIKNHSVTLTVKKGAIEGVSLTEIRNPSTEVATVEVSAPLRNVYLGSARTAVPDVTLEATWAGRPFPLGTTGVAYMPPRSTAALKIVFRQALGTAGLDGKLRVVAYEFGGNQTIGQLNMTLRYGERDVFGLPALRPAALKWEVGQRGTFIRLKDFTPRDDLAIATFYSGGF